MFKDKHIAEGIYYELEKLNLKAQNLIATTVLQIQMVQMRIDIRNILLTFIPEKMVYCCFSKYLKVK